MTADRSSAPPDGWLEVGRLRRPHGLRGDLFVQLTTDRLDRLDTGSELFAAGRHFTVASSRRAGNGRLIVRFDEVADRTAAEQLTNAELYGAPIEDPDALWIHDLIGRRVFDQHDVDRGECVAVVANPAADLLELAGGALVPANFVVGVDDRHIRVDVPDGLFEIADG